MKNRSAKRARQAGGAAPAGTTATSSRRAFLKLAAAGSAAALAAPALALAADVRNPASGAPAHARTPEIEKGIEEQKGYLKQTLAAIRGFDLPVNAEQAFTFAPLRQAKERGR